MMEKFRADYRHVSLFQWIIYANLVVFSIAATVAYMFYTPPGRRNISGKQAPQNGLINMPAVNIETLKVPKKEIKKQLKKVVKQEKNTSEQLI